MKTGMMAVAVLAVLAGCATPQETYQMQQAGGPSQTVTVPKSTMTGAASGAQADALAKAEVQSSNLAQQQFAKVEAQQAAQAKLTTQTLTDLDKMSGQLATIQSTDHKDYQQVEKTLQQLSTIANLQGTGQVTLFFKTGSAELEQFQQNRLITFLDYLSRDSRGRTVTLVTIGSASAIGNAEINKKLSLERANAAQPLIQQYLVNTPHKVYKVAGVGDMFAPKGASTQVEDRYQSVRVIAVYNTSDLPTVPGM